MVLAPRTFALFLVLLCATRASGAGSWLARRWTPLLSGALGAAFFASAMLQTLAVYGGNYSGFLHLSREVAARAPFLQERPELGRSLIVYDAGYDGQFMYLMAFDPFLRRFADRPEAYRAFVDNPPYRYGRIGFSLLTDVVSAGQPERFPAAMMWLIVAAHFALAALLARLATRHGLSPFAGLWYLAIPGFTSSLMSALPEALAAAGIVAGVLCWEARRPVLAAVSFGAALLVRETGVVLLLALVLDGRPARVQAIDARPGCVARAGLRLAPVRRVAAVSRFWMGGHRDEPGRSGCAVRGVAPVVAGGDRPHAAAAGDRGRDRVSAHPDGGICACRCRCSLSAEVRWSSPRRSYAAVAVSLNYDQIWSHLPSGERGTFELFVCLLILLIESRDRPVWIRRTLTGFFLVLFAYTLSHRAGCRHVAGGVVVDPVQELAGSLRVFGFRGCRYGAMPASR